MPSSFCIPETVFTKCNTERIIPPVSYNTMHCKWLASHSGHFSLWDKAASTYWLQGRAHCTARMDVTAERNISSPISKWSRQQSLCWPSYPSFRTHWSIFRSIYKITVPTNAHKYVEISLHTQWSTTVQYGVVYRAIYITTCSLGWWITTWILQCIPFNQISTPSYL